MNPLTQSKNTTILPVLVVLTLACFALSPMARAVVPAPDGGYPGGNTAEGEEALFSLTSGGYNTAIGSFALYSNTTGENNTATGFYALVYNRTGDANTATGDSALYLNTTGNGNTATGADALSSNTSGNNNNAFGSQALFNNTTGPFNNAFGNGALATNTTGNRNTAMGEGAMVASSTGSQNTAVGVSALRNNTTGFGNIAIGQDACNQNGTAIFNTGVGWKALISNTANGNTATGYEALLANSTGNYNTATGGGALFNNTSGSNNVALGFRAGYNLTTGSGNVCIGVNVFGVAGESNTTRISNVYSSVASARPVYVNSGNKTGTLASSRRFKEEIRPMEKASEAILALKPVTFRYKKDIDPSRALSFGLIAEDVAEVNPDLITRDQNGNPETVRYDAVNAMLLNEFLKEHRKNEEQQAIIMQLKSTDAKQEATIAKQQKQIEALTAGLQKVSAQLELGKPAPQTVKNND